MAQVVKVTNKRQLLRLGAANASIQQDLSIIVKILEEVSENQDNNMELMNFVSKSDF